MTVGSENAVQPRDGRTRDWNPTRVHRCARCNKNLPFEVPPGNAALADPGFLVRDGNFFAGDAPGVERKDVLQRVGGGKERKKRGFSPTDRAGGGQCTRAPSTRSSRHAAVSLARSSSAMKRAQARDARAGAGGGAPVPDKHREAIAGPGKCLFALSIRPKDLDAEEGRYARATPARSRTRRPSHSSAPARPSPPARTRRFARTRAATRVPGRPAVFAFPRAFDATRVRRAPPPPFPPHRVAPFPPPAPSPRAGRSSSRASRASRQVPRPRDGPRRDRVPRRRPARQRPVRGLPQVLSPRRRRRALPHPPRVARGPSPPPSRAATPSDALALKAALRALGTNARFSFALDLRTGRVRRVHGAVLPAAVGHAPDGTLLAAHARRQGRHAPAPARGGGGGGDLERELPREHGSARGGPSAPAVVSGGGARPLAARANAHARTPRSRSSPARDRLARDDGPEPQPQPRGVVHALQRQLHLRRERRELAPEEAAAGAARSGRG